MSTVFDAGQAFALAYALLCRTTTLSVSSELRCTTTSVNTIDVRGDPVYSNEYYLFHTRPLTDAETDVSYLMLDVEWIELPQIPNDATRRYYHILQ